MSSSLGSSFGWEETERLIAKETDVFLWLTGDGDKVVGAFLGSPYGRYAHWVSGRYQTCIGPGCEACAHGSRTMVRVALNLYVPEFKAVKVLEVSAPLFSTIKQARDKYGADKWLFEIQRHGGRGDRDVRYTVLPECQIDKDIEAAAGALTLHDLHHVCG